RRSAGTQAPVLAVILNSLPMADSPDARVRSCVDHFFIASKAFAAMTLTCCLLVVPLIAAQDRPTNGVAWRPPELIAADKDVRNLLDRTSASCEFSAADLLARAQKAVQIADARGLVRDRALAIDVLASAYVGQG